MIVTKINKVALQCKK